MKAQTANVINTRVEVKRAFVLMAQTCFLIARPQEKLVERSMTRDKSLLTRLQHVDVVGECLKRGTQSAGSPVLSNHRRPEHDVVPCDEHTVPAAWSCRYTPCIESTIAAPPETRHALIDKCETHCF